MDSSILLANSRTFPDTSVRKSIPVHLGRFPISTWNNPGSTFRLASETSVTWESLHTPVQIVQINENENLPSIEERKKQQEEQSAKAVAQAITAERNRLARELHDAVTQTLFSASLIAEVLPEIWVMDEGEARKSTEELRQLTRGALAEMRTLLLELRPAALSQARLTELLKQLCDAVTGRARLPIDLNIAGDCEMPPEIKLTFYRVAQENSQ